MKNEVVATQQTEKELAKDIVQSFIDHGWRKIPPEDQMPMNPYEQGALAGRELSIIQKYAFIAGAKAYRKVLLDGGSGDDQG